MAARLNDLVLLAHALRDSGYVFVTPTPASHARVNARAGNEWASDLRGVFGWSRPFREGSLDPALVAAMDAAGVLLPVAGGFGSAVRFSSLAGLLFAHSAFPTTAADAVFFGPDTYRFARAIRQAMPGTVRRAVDIGCGAGPGAIVIAHARPAAQVFAVDINDAALAITRANAAAGSVRVQACRSDLLRDIDGAFDLIVANPPYLIDPGARTYRHGGGELGAGLSMDILDAAMDRLDSRGTLLLYTGSAIVDGVDGFERDARSRLAGRNVFWTYEEIDPDVFGEELEHGVYASADRIAAVLLKVTRKD